MHDGTIERREFMGMATMLLGAAALGGCSSVGHAETGARRVAAFSCDVTPPMGTPIYSGFKGLATIEFPLLAKGIILEDGGQRYVLCAADYCELRNSTRRLWQEKIAAAAGTSAERVAIQCVHQHTAPMGDSDASRLLDAVANPPVHASVASFEDPAERVAVAVKEAAARLQPYDCVGTSQAKVERVAANRRVPLEPGKVGFRASSCKDPKLIELPEGLIDPYLKTLTFALGDKPLARLHYYATHPQSFYGDPRASYDFVGMAREKLEAKEGVPQIYFTGCGGNVACGKYNPGTPESRQGLFERLYAAMESSVAAARYAPAEAIQWKTYPLLLTPREDAGYSEADARAKLTKADGSVLERLDGAMTLAWRARSKTPIELNALSMGAIRIVHLCGEPAVEFQLYAQELRPGDFVCVAGYGDGAPGYICLESFFPEGGYEPTASCVIPQSEAAFREAIRTLLQ